MTFLLDPTVTYLNHGSFGACPKEVFDAYQGFQKELEHEACDFMLRRLGPRLRAVRESLESFVGAAQETITLHQNVTGALNCVMHSLHMQGTFKDGDELLTTTHEYGAVNRMLDVYTTPGKVIRAKFSSPIQSQEQLVEELFAKVTEKTKVIFVSHITSPTALILPVKEICKRAREMGILSVVDGAHVPGQLDLSIGAIDPDFYGANCHKWLCSPKGCGFLYVRPSAQRLILPPVVSWGYEPDERYFIGKSGNSYIDVCGWFGTSDPSASLSVPLAIQFLEQNNWKQAMQRSHSLASQCRKAFADKTGIKDHLYPDSEEFYAAMCLLPLGDFPAVEMHKRLFHEYKIEIPASVFEGKNYLRVSFHLYNTEKDIQTLIEAASHILATK